MLIFPIGKVKIIWERFFPGKHTGEILVYTILNITTQRGNWFIPFWLSSNNMQAVKFHLYPLDTKPVSMKLDQLARSMKRHRTQSGTGSPNVMAKSSRGME